MTEMTLVDWVLTIAAVPVGTALIVWMIGNARRGGRIEQQLKQLSETDFPTLSNSIVLLAEKVDERVEMCIRHDECLKNHGRRIKGIETSDA